MPVLLIVTVQFFAAQSHGLGNAGTGISGFAAELAGLGGSLLELVFVIAGFLIISGHGGQGIQKHVRGIIMTALLSALFFKNYVGLSTGAMGLF